MSAALLDDEIILHPEKREFPEFSLERLLGTVFAPTQGCKVCLLIDLEDLSLMKGFGFLAAEGHEIQKRPTRSSTSPSRMVDSTRSA